jgi:putative transposase
MGIARSTYYHTTIRAERQLERDLELRDRIEKINLEFPYYGYRRVYHHLLRQGLRVNGKRIKRVMKEYELYTCLKKWMRPRGTKTGVRLRYPNLIKGLRLSGPNQVWATDITYITLREGYVYLSAVIDVYTRKVVGWSISQSLDHTFCLRSLEVAIKKEKPPRGVIHHSDRGVQYVCEPYVKFLLENGFEISMSAVGTPDDNAFIESFFKTLKREEVYFKQYKSMKEVLSQLPTFIDEVYNKKRLHSALGYQSPEEFEASVLKLKPADRPVQRIWGKAV